MSITRKKLYDNGIIKKLYGEQNPMFGKKSWCNGKTKYTDERLLLIGLKTSKY